jgi:pre-mRNA-splicing factor 38A
MANVTDPLAAFLHGTDPQNLMEYITRQKIYDCRYWKEECFGLTAVNVLEKACTLKCIGASFGGNRQPTKFLCLVLKLLQIQPTDDLVEEFLQTTIDFKYVTALGAFYRRLTGRPADVYQSLEPLYLDYRKLRYRNANDWTILHMDEFVHSLLTQDTVCGIALPRLPQRRLLEQEGYLEGPRKSALSFLFTNPSMSAREYLEKKVEEGSVAAKALWESRRNQSLVTAVGASTAVPGESQGKQGERGPSDKNESVKRRKPSPSSNSASLQTNKRSKTEQYGTLFKSTQSSARGNYNDKTTTTTSTTAEEGSDEYWNKERAKLGLKPLK